MTNSNNDIEELEELLTELEGQEARIVTPYSEEDDAVTRLMEAPLGDQDWMVQVTALDRRMMSTPQLLSELSSGRISSRTLVWRGGMSDWLPIARVEELSRASAAPISAPSRSFVNLAPPPPPPQPSKPVWASPAPSAPLPPPPVAMAPPIGIGMSSTMVSPGMSSSGFGAPPSMGLTPPPPAPVGSAYNLSAPSVASVSPSLPPSSQGNTTRPVAIDFSDMMPENDPPLQSKRWVMALSAVAILAVFVTVYSLSSGGGDEAKAAASATEPQTVSSLQPAASSASKEKPAAVVAAPEKPKAEKQEEPEQAPVATATAKANDDDEATSRSEERSASASTRQTAQARYSPRSEYRRRSRGGSSSSESSRDDDAETPARAATTAKAAAPAAPAAEEEAPTASESPAAVAEEVDEAPKSTGKTSGSTFNRDAAKAALDEAAAQAKNCRPQGGPSGTGRVQVRYEPSGKVANVAILTSKFDNTTTGSCVRMLFRRAKVPEFAGAPVVVVNKSFEIP